MKNAPKTKIFACQVKNAPKTKIFACQVKNAPKTKIFACQVKNAPKTKIFAKNFFRFFEKNSCKSFFGGYNRAHEKHIRCFSPLPFRTYGGFVMATRKEINVNSLANFATNMLSCIHHYRKDNAEVLSPKQHEYLDELVYSAMELISIANIMPPKKQVGYRVDNIVNRARRNIGNVLSFKERIENEPLYITYLNFFSFAEVVLNKYTHKEER